MNEGRAYRGLLEDLRERAKELECLYRVEEELAKSDESLERSLERVVQLIPEGWQHPEICAALLEVEGEVYRSQEFEPTSQMIHADIEVQGRILGRVAVYYLEDSPPEDEGPFLAEEVRLIRSLADRLAHHILYSNLQQSNLVDGGNGGEVLDWARGLRLLREADREQYARLSRRMLNHLVSMGVTQAADMLGRRDAELVDSDNENQPERTVATDRELLLSDAPFDLASSHLSNDEIMSLVQQWLYEEKVAAFNKVLADPKASLGEVADALRRFRSVSTDIQQHSRSTVAGLRASLLRRTLSSQTEFIRLARDYVDPFDFVELFDHLVVSDQGHGTVGGKSAGLLLANWILDRRGAEDPDVPRVKVPRAWFLTSDSMVAFIKHNDLEGVIEQKYKEIDHVRQEYPNIVQLFKSSAFPPEIVKGLSVALDDLGEGTPLIIRSSSLLEDRLGTAFSGKYKSLFVSNLGTKRERLNALIDAIAEVYASVFGPDPIEYRRDRGLLDFHEEMGVLIQAVVGKRVGRWFLPAFAGVAFSRNEFRWSPRIRREDGIVRVVPGLGTRAVDRTADDYPVLSVPGRPGLRANVAIDEIIRYSPQWVDCIDLEEGRFVSITLEDLLQEAGTDLPGFELVFSAVEGDRLRPAHPLLTDPDEVELVANFEGLLSNSSFSQDVRRILDTLEDALENPVDIEFAHDGEQLYLLQCRPQSSSPDERPDAIPQDLDQRTVVFTANRYVSNGHVPDLTHLVYVDPLRYAELPSEREMRDVGHAVGRLNEMLPKRQFALMGPGRWGSRGDIKLGVPITYSEINNSALLIEIARKKGGYVPDLSFGTHFFQDLVESHIRYLPLYPDESGVVFNEPFFTRSDNLLVQLAPEYAHLEAVVKVIDVPAVTDGHVLRVLLNAELDQAVAMICDPQEAGTSLVAPPPSPLSTPTRAVAESWRWRQRMAERIARRIRPEARGIAAMYLFGSVKNGTAGPGSDIDLLVHFRGDEQQKADLERWFEGWSECLAELNYLRTGYQVDSLLDVHFITDDDIESQTSFASKIGAITDAAAPLPLDGQDEG